MLNTSWRKLMNWEKLYSDKIMSAKDAIAYIKPGDTIHSTMFSSVPYALFKELTKQKDRLSGVNIYMGFGGRLYRPLANFYNGHVNVNSMFFGPAERTFKYTLGSNIDFQVLQLSQSFDDRANYHKADVIMMAATPPDKEGNMSFGLIPIDTELCHMARNVIVQVNKNIPYIRGKDNMINIKDVTAIVHKNERLCVLGENEPNDSDKRIAEIIADRIPNGACLQFGIGGLSTAMGECCKDKRHLGIHTEMFVESMVDLIKCGAVDNSMKKIDQGISTFGFAMGSKKMNRFLDHNPTCESRRFMYSNDPYIIAQNDNVISVNSAMQVDITGQVAAESIGFKQYSGIGGQLDFVRGSQMSKGGHSYIAFNSLWYDKMGKPHSKIVLAHPPGTAVTTPRSEVEYIVTEYGIADLKYQTIEQRAKRLIQIAHPDFREELTRDAKKYGLII